LLEAGWQKDFNRPKPKFTFWATKLGWLFSGMLTGLNEFGATPRTWGTL